MIEVALIDQTGELVVQARRMNGFGRLKGLIGSDRLKTGRGVLLKTRQIHTIGVRFPIDAIYLSASGEILRIRTIRPMRVGPVVMGARWVLEMREGEAVKKGLKRGDVLTPADGSELL